MTHSDPRWVSFSAGTEASECEFHPAPWRDLFVEFSAAEVIQK